MIIAFANQKGGVGKSTSVRNISHHLTKMGYRVLMIDADPQASLTEMCGISDTTRCGMVEVMSGQSSISDAMTLQDGIFLLSSDLMLSEVEMQIHNRMFARESVLKDAISPLRSDFDYILIDCPPNLNLLTINALIAANYVVIPALPHVASARGVELILSTIESVQSMNPQLEVLGVLLNQWRGYIHHKRVKIALDGLGVNIFETRIGETVDIAGSAEDGYSLAQYSPHNPQVKNYKQLTQEIVDWTKENQNAW